MKRRVGVRGGQHYWVVQMFRQGHQHGLGLHPGLSQYLADGNTGNCQAGGPIAWHGQPVRNTKI